MSSIKSCLLSLLVSSIAHAADVNVTLNKPVTLNNGDFPEYVSTIGPCNGDVPPPQQPAGSIVDGTFPSERSCYQEGLYWHTFNWIDINLGGAFLLTSAIVQADSNDTYVLQYRDIAGVYRPWWTVPKGSIGGLETRPNSNQTQRQSLTPVVATGLRFLASGPGDGEYSVSEIQAFGSSLNVIDIGASLANPTFTSSAGPSPSCPTSWTCDGSPAPGFSSYKPTAAQYSNASSFTTVGFSPTTLGGSGAVRQITPLKWIGGATYVLNLWRGFPNTEPDGKTPVDGWAPTARVYLAAAVNAQVSFEQVAFFDIPKPPKGTLVENPITFQLPVGSPFVGKKVAIVIFVDAPSRYSANFAILPVDSQIVGAAEKVDNNLLFTGWVNFGAASGGTIQLDWLRRQNGASSCVLATFPDPCSDDILWGAITNPFKPVTDPRPPVANAGIQYDWDLGFQDSLVGTCCWARGGTERFRVKASLDGNSPLLPVIEPSGFRHHLSEWILTDPTTIKGAPFLNAKISVDPEETNRYYKAVNICPEETLTNCISNSGYTIKDGLATKQNFIDQYFTRDPANTTTATATYYNSGDLGIGRRMHCAANRQTKETACYVENYADPDGNGDKTGSFGDPNDAQLAFDNSPDPFAEPPGKPFATVAMVDRGKMPFGTPNKVFFAVYGDSGDCVDSPPPNQLRCEAKLDTSVANISIPGNCIVCHGSASEYSADPPRVKNAFFLPFDLNSFAGFGGKSLLFQESDFRKLNQMVYTTYQDMTTPGGKDLLPDAIELIKGWYGGDVNKEGATFNRDFVPKGWMANANDKRLYGSVVAPYCRTCHITHTAETQGDPDTLRFASFDDLAIKKPTILLRACGSLPNGSSNPAFAARPMPNAEQTSNGFWQTGARAELLDGLSITTQGCDPPPPVKTTSSIGVQALSTVQFSFLGVLQQYKSENCACTTIECLKKVADKYVGQTSAMDFSDPAAEQTLTDIMKCQQQIVTKAKMFGP